MSDLPGRVLLSGVVGSTAYGLATEHSDVDTLGVYLAPTERVLGLDGRSATDASRVSTDPDRTLHEIGKYCALALKGNPTVMELLWLPEYTERTAEGGQLLALREAFLSEGPVRRSYVGYATQQARKLASRQARGDAPPARTAKHGRHCLRLLRQARALLATGRLPIDVGAQRAELFAAGELAATDAAAFQELFARECARLDAVESVLPEVPDRARVDAWLVAVRRSELRG